jgi:hypothetical protein
MKNLNSYHIQPCPHCHTQSNDFLKLIEGYGSSLLLHDTESLHYQVHCEVCGASGPFGGTPHEALTLWEYTHKITADLTCA